MFKSTLKTVILVLVIHASHVSAESMTVLSEDYPPFQWVDSDGKATGFGVDLVKTIFATAKLPMANHEIVIMPWVRAYQETLKNKNTAVFMTVRTMERDPLFKWVGPLFPRRIWLFALGERTDLEGLTFEAAKKKIIGGYRASASTNYLKQLGFINVPEVDTPLQNFKKLISGRVDMVPSIDLQMSLILKKYGYEQSKVKKILLLDERFNYYLAINIETSDKTVTQLQQAFDQLKASGTYQKLYQQWLAE